MIMSSPDDPLLRGGTRVAYAVVRGSVPRVYIAEDSDVLARVLALDLVTKTSPTEVDAVHLLREMREAVLDERWSDAVVAWMAATGTTVDIYDDEPVRTARFPFLPRGATDIQRRPLFSTRARHA